MHHLSDFNFPSHKLRPLSYIFCMTPFFLAKHSNIINIFKKNEMTFQKSIVFLICIYFRLMDV